MSCWRFFGLRSRQCRSRRRTEGGVTAGRSSQCGSRVSTAKAERLINGLAEVSAQNDIPSAVANLVQLSQETGLTLTAALSNGLVVRAAEPVDFQDINGYRPRIVFILLARTVSTQLLWEARLSFLLQGDEVVKAVLSAKTPRALCEVFRP